MKERLKDLNICFGKYPTGKHNAITDVPGVKVGHYTLEQDQPVCLRTGVTAVIPGEGNIYESPVFACSHTINGYGKSTGLMQVDELGNLETPILLTNTLNVGNVSRGLVDYVISQNPDCKTVNPVVMECNDSKLNHIQTEAITREMVFAALEKAETGKMESGAVGAGTGMVCYGYKGGIGTASRSIVLDNRNYTMGALVLSNFGDKSQLTIKGVRIKPFFKNPQETEIKGSIIVILGTDIPLSHRQLKRISQRTIIGIARTGGRCAHASGEIVIAFSNGNRNRRTSENNLHTIQVLHEDHKTTSMIFDATIDCVEEAIIDSLFSAKTVQGINKTLIHSLPVDEVISIYGKQLRKNKGDEISD